MVRASAQKLSAASLSFITIKTVSSPPREPTTALFRIASIAIAAACPKPGNVLITTMFCAVLISVTHSLKILRKRVVKLLSTSDEATAYLYLPVSDDKILIKRSSLISRETVACVVLYPTFLVCHFCHRAGINHTNICFFTFSGCSNSRFL